MKPQYLIGFLALLALAGPSARADNILSVTQYGVAATSLPWGVARDQGFFKTAGAAIDGIVSSNGGGTSVRNMMASGLPFAEVATSAGIAAYEAGLDIAFIYSANNNTADMAWVTMPQSPVKTIADLKGRKVGFTNPHSTTEMLVHMSLHAAGIDQDVGYLSTGGVAAGWTVLEQGAIDAAPVDDMAFAPKGRFRVIFYVRDYVPNVTWTVGITTRAFAKAHPDEVQHLILARRIAVDFMREHPAEAARTYAKDWQIDEPTAVEVLNKMFADNYWSRGDFNMTGLQTMVDGMKMVGALPKPIDLATLIDKSFLPEDLR
jgi:NitT/TauT family transport system substrate-binding protein